jgi:dipeptide/tripeptide permease
MVFVHRVLEFGSDLAFELFSSVNPMTIVFVGPAAIIVYGVLRVRGRPVPGAQLAAIGMGAVAVGLLLMLPPTLDLLGDDFYAPAWSDQGPSMFWPVLSVTVIALGEILVFGLVPALVTSVSPRRFRGLVYGAAFAVGPLAALVTSPFDFFAFEVPRWGLFVGLSVVTVIGAGIAFTGGLIAPKRDR